MGSKWIKGVPPQMLNDQFGLYRGVWMKEMDRCWLRESDGTCVCSRLIRTKFGKVEHVTITLSDASRAEGLKDFTWAEKQEIKNELFGENRFAIEVYPKEERLVDMADVYHLWVFDKKLDMPFGIHPKEFSKAPAIKRGYSVSLKEIETLKNHYDGVKNG